jgi:uncharacterized membrane protein YdjX (TVP38/TMEM64 family)
MMSRRLSTLPVLLVVAFCLLQSTAPVSSFQWKNPQTNIRPITFHHTKHAAHSQRILSSSRLNAASPEDILALLGDPVEHPVSTLVGSYLLVTASDMIPFVPCQPLAMALGAKLGFAYAFPVTLAGQTTAGLLAFFIARQASDSSIVQQKLLQTLDHKTLEKFQDFKDQTSGEDEQDSKTILLGLIGLRLAPFFPFSAGNYLLGGATAVPYSLFGIATVFGCCLSNLLSTSVGAGGAMLWVQQMQQSQQQAPPVLF